MSETKVKLGVAFDLNGQAIALQPKEAIDEIAAKGIELTLPKPVSLGEAGKGIDSILGSLEINNYRVKAPETKQQNDPVTYLNETIQGLGIEALNKAYEKVIKAELSVEKFYVKIPGSSATDKATKYTIGLAATWKKDDTLSKLSGLTLTGIYFEVSNE
jgi:hypothetical protein